MVGDLTGHCPIDSIAMRLYTYLVGSKLPELYGGRRGGIIQTLFSAVAKLRLKHLGSYTFDELGEVAEIAISRLNVVDL